MRPIVFNVKIYFVFAGATSNIYQINHFAVIRDYISLKSELLFCLRYIRIVKIIINTETESSANIIDGE